MKMLKRRLKWFLASALTLAAAGCAQTAAAQTQNTCNNAQIYASATLTANTQVITVPTNISGLAVHICSYALQISQTSTAVTFGLVSGTGSVCATGQALVTPKYLGATSAVQLVAESFSAGSALNVPAGQNVCLVLSGTPTGAVVRITWAAY
jgi:hypothetical protein